MFPYSAVTVGLGLLSSFATVAAAPQGGQGVNPLNTLGTSLVDFIDCKKVNDFDQKQFIRDAYKEAHTIVNVDGVKANIRWDSEAAVDFFGPPQFNGGEQGQIQAVLANVETMQTGYWWNPFGHSLQVRCDDPKTNCAGGVTAYTVNPKGNEHPYINFCPGFFRQYTLDKAVSNYKDDKNPEIKWNVDNYQNRGLIFLHELFHLDLAADSVKGDPNPKIYDIVIRYNDRQGNIRGPERAYAARLSKLLARFLPRDTGKDAKSTGYWVQRNVDNFSRFAMAKYLEGKIGGYPMLPMIYDKLLYPVEPRPRQGKTAIGFQASDGSDANLDLDTSDLDAGLLTQADIDPSREGESAGEFVVGKPIALDAYPESYRKAHKEWLDMLQGKSDGKCQARVEEIRTCGDESSNLFVRISITDANGAVLYTTPRSTQTPGKPVGMEGPLKITEAGMNGTFTVERGDSYDFLRFGYGSTSWKSSDTSGDASCRLDGDDWNPDGPKCSEGALTRTFECQYPCGKQGG